MTKLKNLLGCLFLLSGVIPLSGVAADLDDITIRVMDPAQPLAIDHVISLPEVRANTAKHEDRRSRNEQRREREQRRDREQERHREVEDRHREDRDHEMERRHESEDMHEHSESGTSGMDDDRHSESPGEDNPIKK
ncbi:MAG: hypothetical protein AABY83_15435 [Pseudomonadota bacterium]